MQRVIEVCKKHLPSLSVGFSNAKVRVHIEDAAEFIQQHRDYFDIIITDCCDPTAPGN